jgi:hypothetical protein
LVGEGAKTCLSRRLPCRARPIVNGPAVRIGVAPTMAGATDAAPVTVGLRRAKSWSVPVESFRLGDDGQAKPRLRIADVSLPVGIDMLIGADFFAAHRVYVARDQKRIEFTDAGAAC